MGATTVMAEHRAYVTLYFIWEPFDWEGTQAEQAVFFKRHAVVDHWGGIGTGVN